MATVRETHLSSGNHKAIGQTEQIELSGFGRASHVRFDRFCSILWVGGRRASVVQIAERRAAERIHAAFFCVLERSYLASSGRRIIGGSCADDLLQRPEGPRRVPFPKSEINAILCRSPDRSARSSEGLRREGRGPCSFSCGKRWGAFAFRRLGPRRASRSVVRGPRYA